MPPVRIRPWGRLLHLYLAMFSTQCGDGEGRESADAESQYPGDASENATILHRWLVSGVRMYIDDIQVYSQDEQSRKFKTLFSLSLSRSHTTKTPSDKDYQDEEIGLRTKKWQEANMTISSRRIPAQGRTWKGRWMGIEAWRRMPHKCLMNIGLRRTRSKGRGRQRILRLIGRTLGSIAIICVSPLYQLRSHLRHPYRSTPRLLLPLRYSQFGQVRLA
ncbi:hypothetical protein FIBSPDRAFT_113628 [Athelia psychrophila]|uniref:Uncharacterized protein n=1 Tax=Athelia psychrophila TaxID=1759441 RepID=A0A166D4C8_9AGAM|nr:hypothetical protein FIBSPDRAFT_113628 [Fibularhizoctonia sp. CBS 109695]